MCSGCHPCDVLPLIYTGASCNHIVYTAGTSGLVKSQYAKMGIQKVYAKRMPIFLKDDPKEHHMQVFQDMIERLQAEPDFLCRVITGNLILITGIAGSIFIGEYHSIYCW